MSMAGKPGTDIGGVRADQARVLQALAAEAQQRVGGRQLGQLVAARAVGLEGDEAGIEREHARGRLGRLLGIAVDGAHLLLGGRRARHGVERGCVHCCCRAASRSVSGCWRKAARARSKAGSTRAGIELGAFLVGVDRSRHS